VGNKYIYQKLKLHSRPKVVFIVADKVNGLVPFSMQVQHSQLIGIIGYYSTRLVGHQFTQPAGILVGGFTLVDSKYFVRNVKCSGRPGIRIVPFVDQDPSYGKSRICIPDKVAVQVLNAAQLIVSEKDQFWFFNYAASLFCSKLDPSIKVSFNGKVREGDPLNWLADISGISQLGLPRIQHLKKG